MTTVNFSEPVAEDVLHEAEFSAMVLGDPVRVQIIALLIDKGEMQPSELASVLGRVTNNLAMHLTRLRAVGAVVYRQAGRERHYRLAYPELAGAFIAWRRSVRGALGFPGA